MELEVTAQVSNSYYQDLKKDRVLRKLPTIEGLVGKATYVDMSYVDPAGVKHLRGSFQNTFRQSPFNISKTGHIITLVIDVKDYKPYPINPNLQFPAQQILSADEWKAKTQAGITPTVEKWHLQHIKDMGFNAIEYYQGSLFIRVLLDNTVYKLIDVIDGVMMPANNV